MLKLAAALGASLLVGCVDGGQPPNLFDGVAHTTYFVRDEALTEDFDAAMLAWVEACGVPLVRLTKDENRAVVVYLEQQPVGLAAQALARPGRRRIVVSPDVEQGETRTLVLKHEIGHMLGIEHQASGLMNAITGDKDMPVTPELCQLIKPVE